MSVLVWLHLGISVIERRMMNKLRTACDERDILKQASGAQAQTKVPLQHCCKIGSGLVVIEVECRDKKADTCGGD